VGLVDLFGLSFDLPVQAGSQDSVFFFGFASWVAFSFNTAKVSSTTSPWTWEAMARPQPLFMIWVMAVPTRVAAASKASMGALPLGL